MNDDDLAIALAALGQPIRLKLYRKLVVVGVAGSGPGALADAVGLERSLVSYHLQPLVAARLVRSEKRGRDVNYQVDLAGLSKLAAAMLGLSEPR